MPDGRLTLEPVVMERLEDGSVVKCPRACNMSNFVIKNRSSTDRTLVIRLLDKGSWDINTATAHRKAIISS
jgi:hypothetical protein